MDTCMDAGPPAVKTKYTMGDLEAFMTPDFGVYVDFASGVCRLRLDHDMFTARFPCNVETFMRKLRDYHFKKVRGKWEFICKDLQRGQRIDDLAPRYPTNRRGRALRSRRHPKRRREAASMAHMPQTPTDSMAEYYTDTDRNAKTKYTMADLEAFLTPDFGVHMRFTDNTCRLFLNHDVFCTRFPCSVETFMRKLRDYHFKKVRGEWEFVCKELQRGQRISDLSPRYPTNRRGRAMRSRLNPNKKQRLAPLSHMPLKEEPLLHVLPPQDNVMTLSDMALHLPRQDLCDYSDSEWDSSSENSSSSSNSGSEPGSPGAPQPQPSAVATSVEIADCFIQEFKTAEIEWDTLKCELGGIPTLPQERAHPQPETLLLPYFDELPGVESWLPQFHE